MRSPIGPWLLLVLVTAACIDRSRVNAACEWTSDSGFPIDPHNPAHRQHLVADAQLAEELAIRYADAEHLRRFGYEGHGGLIDRGGVRNECMARLVSAIERNHAVTPDQIAAARGQRNRLFDAAVGLSFLPLYCGGAAIACLAMRRRFQSDHPRVRLAVTFLTSAAISFLGFQLLQLWSGLWEVGRVGNGHMSSFRAATHDVWSHQHVGVLLAGGVLLFWLVAMLCDRIGPIDDGSGADVRHPQALLLR
jgi:hypothetical protein